MAFKVPTKQPNVAFVCDACSARVEYHSAMLNVYERDGAWRHDECTEIMHDRPRGRMHPEKR